ncbi:hypothetical protein AB0I95_03210 [Micromonospora sp. NPDC049751]
MSGFVRRPALAEAQRDRSIAPAREVKTVEEKAAVLGGRTITLPLDVTDAAAAKAADATAVETFGGVDEAVDDDDARLRSARSHT